MKAILTITPESNIDFNERKVINLSEVTKQLYQWTDAVEIYDERKRMNDIVNISHISLYDHILIINGIKYKILHMFSAENLG